MIYDAAPGFKFGCDPELFIIDRNGQFVGAEGIIPGTKEEPYKVKCGAWQVDGMAAEFNIDPATNYKEFDRNISTVLATGRKYLPEGYDFAFVPCARFSKAEMDKASEKAKELGCNPDFNAWTGGANTPPDATKEPGLRTASGHLHIGWTDDADLGDETHIMNCRDLVKQLDWYLAAWSLRADADATRRRLYGKAGACRYKPYGVEYRVLSNFWLTSGANRVAVWNRMVLAIQDMTNLEISVRTPLAYNNLLIESINNSVPNSNVEKMGKYPIRSLDKSYCVI